MKFILEEVETLPKILEPGVFYHSAEFEVSSHLCACGCGDKIILPIDDQHHHILLSQNSFSVRPSIGNWGVCDAHYFITDGVVKWMPGWSKEAIARGRQFEDARRHAHYETKADLSLIARIGILARKTVVQVAAFARSVANWINPASRK